MRGRAGEGLENAFIVIFGSGIFTLRIVMIVPMALPVLSALSNPPPPLLSSSSRLNAFPACGPDCTETPEVPKRSETELKTELVLELAAIGYIDMIVFPRAALLASCAGPYLSGKFHTRPDMPATMDSIG